MPRKKTCSEPSITHVIKWACMKTRLNTYKAHFTNLNAIFIYILYGLLLIAESIEPLNTPISRRYWAFNSEAQFNNTIHTIDNPAVFDAIELVTWNSYSLINYAWDCLFETRKAYLFMKFFATTNNNFLFSNHTVWDIHPPSGLWIGVWK